jgi:hypothetical protein
MLRFLAESVPRAGYVPGDAVFNGISDVCSDVEELAQGAKRALDANSLCREVSGEEIVPWAQGV